MSPVGDLLSVATLFSNILEQLGLRYAFGGAIAQNYWGTVRATLDIDVLVDLPRLRYQDFVDAVTAHGFYGTAGAGVELSVQQLISEERDRHLFVLYKDLVKLEVFTPFLPIQHAILRRAVSLELGAQQAPITPAEELIVLKMAFHREKDLRDVRAMLWNQKGKLDLAYLRDWAHRMLNETSEEMLQGWIGRYVESDEQK